MKSGNVSLLLLLIIVSRLSVNGRYISQDQLKSGDRLNNGDCLVSFDKRFYLCMQDDGNLVIYKGSNYNSRRSIWHSSTHGKGLHPHKLEMQRDGNLVIYDGKGAATWASGTHDRGAKDASVFMQSDGNLVIYNSSPRDAIWSSGTHSSSGIECQREDKWPNDWTKFEDDVLLLVNQNRGKGANCGGRWRDSVSPIRKNDKLRRAARCHAVDMGLHDYFDHVDKQGATIGKRIQDVDYHFRKVAENIAKGQTSPEEVVQSWMNSPGHCNNIMNDYQEIGIGHIGLNYYQTGLIWVQNFGNSF